MTRLAARSQMRTIHEAPSLARVLSRRSWRWCAAGLLRLDSPPVARFVLLTALVLVLAGCSDSVPGGKVVSATPVTVIGAVSEPWTGGNAAGGAAAFSAGGCGACHTLSAAHATGTVGPDLDKIAAYAAHASQDSLDEFIYEAIASPPAAYVPPGFPTNVMPTTFGQSLKPKQLADLVAYIAKGP